MDVVFNSLKIVEQWLENKWIQIILAGIMTYVGVKVVEKIVKHFFKRTNFLEEKKEKTLENIFMSLVTYAAAAGYIFFVISQFVTDFTKLLAGAGVLGIILGFGAQNLIKDVLAGIFFLWEKQIRRDDFVKINNTYTGTVEEVGLRVIKIRNFSGRLLSISNGSVREIENYNMEKMRVIEKVTTSFYQDPSEVFEALEEVCHELNEKEKESLLTKNEEAVEPFKVYGMTSLNEGYHGYEYAITALVKDEEYWRVSREARRMIAQKFYNRNIRMAEENMYHKARIKG